MCGIAGAAWTADGKPLDEVVLKRMTGVLQHRGPDDDGFFLERTPDGGGVALGHRRLSIIDVDGGHQPLANEDESVWVAFNGEIYNYRELRSQLESDGHCFRTNTDTEVLVHLYEDMGVACLGMLRGMFAFALWDARRRRLFLARDRLGQKPLVYCQESGRLLYASEIKALLQVPGVRREVDPVAIDEYLALFYVPHPRTMFRGIRKLPPAHYAVYEDDRLTIKRYWHPDCDMESNAPVDEIRANLEHELDESVRLRLRSDVPLGAFLSGGIDSTAIVGLMQRHLPSPARTFTIGFPVADYDETAHARVAADHLGTEHQEFQIQPASIEILPVLAWHFDEPFADSSAIPTYYVSQVTSQHVKVALTGDGGDELFGGYPRYRTLQRLSLLDRLPQRLRVMFANSLCGLLPNDGRESSFLRRLGFRMQAVGEPLQQRYARWVTIFQRDLRYKLYSPEMAARLQQSDPTAFITAAMQVSDRRDAGTRAMHADLLTYLPADLLAKVDICSMAHGLECRSPFLDHRVVELALSIPFRHIAEGKRIKPMLTGTLPELIPPALRARPKMGFRIPLDDWFRGELEPVARDMLLDDACVGRGYFSKASLRKFLDDHTSGRWNHGDRIWALLCLEMWHRTFIDPPDPPTGPVSGSLSRTQPSVRAIT